MQTLFSSYFNLLLFAFVSEDYCLHRLALLCYNDEPAGVGEPIRADFALGDRCFRRILLHAHMILR